MQCLATLNLFRLWRHLIQNLEPRISHSVMSVTRTEQDFHHHWSTQCTSLSRYLYNLNMFWRHGKNPFTERQHTIEYSMYTKVYSTPKTTRQIMSLKQWCHCEWGGLTLNWCWKAVSWFWWSLFFILVMATLRLVAAICVSPHVTDSKIASWMNANCSWTKKEWTYR